MSARPCVACGKGIPEEVFAGRGAGEGDGGQGGKKVATGHNWLAL